MIGPKAVIHLDNLVHNYRLIKDRIGDIPLMAVVKANAYGHGAVPVTKTLKQAGVKHFAVFSFEEALELRDAGIEEDILLFSRFDPKILNQAIEKRLTLNLSWPEDLRILKDFHRTYGKSPVVHIKVDTGMTRLGMPFESIQEILNELKRSPEIRCEGIYSHYATADEGDLSYAEFQLDRFNNAVEASRRAGLSFKWIHFSNSGAVLNLPQSYFNMVRVGILLYGAFPSDEVPMDMPLKPVMEFKGPVVTVRPVDASTRVSYGGKWSAPRKTNIGVIQTGFADGFPRPWYENGSVSFQGQRFGLAGRVCMDQLTVDFDQTVPEIGDEVLFFGENDTDRLPVEEIAKAIGSTSYVLFTAVGGRTERTYVGQSG